MTLTITGGAGPHSGRRIARAGASLDEAAAAMILIHGRGAGSADILGLSDAFARPDVAYFAPEAAGNVWYPQRFVMPLWMNQPDLDSAISVIAALADAIAAGGVPHERIVLAGFSQGACLALEVAARHPRRWGGVVALSGGLIGEPDDVTRHEGSLEGTPAILCCSDDDAHIPLPRVIASAEMMDRMGAEVVARIIPGMGHTVTMEEVALVRDLLRTLVETGAASGSGADTD